MGSLIHLGRGSRLDSRWPIPVNYSAARGAHTRKRAMRSAIAPAASANFASERHSRVDRVRGGGERGFVCSRVSWTRGVMGVENRIGSSRVLYM